MNKISIVTVTFNCIEQLKVTAQNVLRQDYPDLEYIIIDGASTDGTAQYARELAAKDSRVKSWSEPDKGIFDAMNKGVRHATGEWINFMNAGDTFASADVLTQIFSDPTAGYDIIYGDVIKNGIVKKAEMPHNAHRMFFCHQSCLASRRCLTDIPFDITHKMSADIKFVKQAFLKGYKFLKMDFPIAIFDTHGVSNVRRSAGLWDNILVMHEVDSLSDRCRFIPRLFFQYLWCRIRGK